MPKCTCSYAAALGDITAKQCGEDFGQTQLLVFQRLLDGDGDANKLTVATNKIAESVITTALAATDATKIVVSPMLYNPDTAAGDSQSWGGGNQTPNGVTMYLGADGTEFTAELRYASQDVIKQLKNLQCEAQGGRLGVYLLDGNGVMKGIGVYTASQSTTTLTGLSPIPVASLFVGDLNLKGTGEPDYNNLKLQFKAGWSDDTMNVEAITPDKMIQDVIAAQNA